MPENYEPFPKDGPCDLCHKGGGPADVTDKRSSEDWCREMDACAATIDWEKVFGRD